MKVMHSPGLVVALLLTGTSAASAWQLGSFRSVATAKIEADSSIIWAPDRPLARGDFRSAVPDAPGEVGAVTASGMMHAIECDANHLEYAVYALFQPRASWTRPGALLDTPVGVRELAHEQGHFDLTEIAARRFRAELRTFRAPCDSAVKAFNALAEAADAGLIARQTQYDSETVHSTNVPEQARWLAIIRAELDSIPAGTVWNSRKYWKQ
jgi:hypothetical protein